MPAALAITPLPGVAAVKTTSEPAVFTPAEGTGAEGFGQVLRSVSGTATGVAAASAPINAAQGQAAAAHPNGAVAATEDTTAGQMATLAPALPGKAATPHTAAPAAKPTHQAKPEHAGKQDHRADAARSTDPGASTSSPAVVLLPEVVTNPAVDPLGTTVPATPVSAGGDHLIPVQAALATIGPAQPTKGATPSQPAKETHSKQKAPTEAASAPVAVPVQPQAVDAPVAAPINAVRLATEVTVPVGGWGAASSGGVAASGVTLSGPAPPSSGSGSQTGSATADMNAPSQPVPAAGLDVLGQTAVPAPVLPNQIPPTAAAETARPAASGGDHKVTLRPVEAGADPAKPAVPSGSVQQLVVPAGTPVLASATATPTAAAVAPHRATPASAMEQLAPALLTLAKTADGGQQMTVRLHPADLGMVQVRIAQAAAGTTQIEITADNPATLLALQRDQPQLHRALDDAGIAAAGRTVTFHVAQPAQAAAGGNGAALPNGHGATQQAPAGRTGAGSTDADGSAGGGRGSYAAGERAVYPTRRQSGTAPSAAGATARTAGTSYRIGLDITA